MLLAPGARLGPYEILSALGAGGMGEVYRARDTRLGRDIALKILPAELANDPSRRQRFEFEARAVAALNHPNIVAIYDVGAEAGVAYMVSELVDGEPLRPGKFSQRKTLDLAVQITAGLAAAHDAGITHRDLKPANILVSKDGRAKILDFGLAKQRATRAAEAGETVTVRTEPGVVMGTVGYMSPEQVRGQETDPRSDIFSFGVILHELLSGRRAFQGETSVDTMQAILRQEPPDLPDTVPSAVRQVISHCLEKDPANRFQSARDLGFALSAMAQTGSHSAPAPVLAPSRPPWMRYGLAALAAIALIAAGALLARSWLQSPASPAWTGVLLGGPEVSQIPRLSPDGHTLAFLGSGDEFSQVAVMRPDSGNWAVLTHATDKGFCNADAWSPDGTKIYFDRWTDVPRGVYSIPVLGGTEQLVLEDAGDPEALPDGTLLLVRFNAERQLQLFRFWPETGRLQGFPLEVTGGLGSPARAFPDGKEAVVIATLIGPGRDAGQQAYILDLANGKVRALLPPSPDSTIFRTVAVARDGKSVLAVRTAGNLASIASISRDGRILAPSILTLTNSVWSLDTGPGGSLYLDQVDRPVDLVRFSPQGGHAERIATLPPYEAPGSPVEDNETFAVLPGGRLVFTLGTGGRLRLMVLDPGKDPLPLINTSEPTSAPVTAAGPDLVAFLMGPEPRQTIALATTSNGRITRRIAPQKGAISSLASSPDGKMLYFAAGGNIWSIPAAGGESKKIRAGDHVAADPAGRYLLVEVTETPVIRLIRVPLHGGAEQEIPRTGELRPAFIVGPNAIGQDSRIVMPLGSSTWFWPPGLLDPATGEIKRIPLDYTADFHILGWDSDGKVLGLALGMHSKLWKFVPAAAR